MTPANDRLIATLIFLIVTGVSLAFSTKQGIHRDEAYYMDAGERYVTYYEHALTGVLKNPLSDVSIRPYWSYNREHPPFLKTLYGISWRLLHHCTCAKDRRWHPPVARLQSGRHATLSLLSEVTAFRLPAMAFFGLLCALVYLFFVAALGSRLGGLAAALLMFAQPRAFFHALTAGIDLPTTTLWFATMFAYWRALRTESRFSAIVTGLLFGLLLSAKLNSFFLPLALGAHWIWLYIQRRRGGLKPPTARPLVMMAALGPVVVAVLWPWLWHDPIRRLWAYLSFHLHHVHYNFEYLARNYNHPPYPWHEPLGMLLFTAPVVLLVLAVAGIVFLSSSGVDARRGCRAPDETATGVLMLCAGFLPIALFMPGTVPIYGATKHWLATMPYLALCAGVAVDRLGNALLSELGLQAESRWRTTVSAALLFVVFAPAAVETLRSHPYGLSHYNALAGGVPGGADLGLNRQFWGYSTNGLIPWLNENLPARTRLYLHDTNHDSYELYQRDGRLRRDIANGRRQPNAARLRRRSDAALLIHEKHFNRDEYMIWEAYGHVQPAEVLTLDGVPLVTVYLRTPQKAQ